MPGSSNTVVDGIAQKVVPKVAREKLLEITQRQVDLEAQQVVPRLAREIATKEVKQFLSEESGDIIKKAVEVMHKKITGFGLIILVAILVSLILSFYQFFKSILS